MDNANSAPAAGWYADPSTPGTMRWWDGVQWTEHTQAGAQTPAASTPQMVALPGGPQSGYATQAPVNPSYVTRVPAGSGGTSTKAVLALVLPFVLGVFGGIAGIILGRQAMREIDAGSGQSGRGLAKAGMIIGWIEVVLVTIYIGFIVLAIAMGGVKTKTSVTTTTTPAGVVTPSGVAPPAGAQTPATPAPNVSTPPAAVPAA